MPSALQASDRVYYLYQTLADAAEAIAGSPEGPQALAAAQQQLASGGGGAARGPGDQLAAEVQAGLTDDLNTPVAVAALSGALKAMNDLLHTKQVGRICGEVLVCSMVCVCGVLELCCLLPTACAFSPPNRRWRPLWRC